MYEWSNHTITCNIYQKHILIKWNSSIFYKYIVKRWKIGLNFKEEFKMSNIAMRNPWMTFFTLKILKNVIHFNVKMSSKKITPDCFKQMNLFKWFIQINLKKSISISKNYNIILKKRKLLKINVKLIPIVFLLKNKENQINL